MGNHKLQVEWNKARGSGGDQCWRRGPEKTVVDHFQEVSNN